MHQIGLGLRAFVSAMARRQHRVLRLLLMILLIMLVLGALPTWPYSHAWGYYPSGGLGLILVIVLVIFLVGGRRAP